MKLFDLYIRILKKQIWLYLIYLLLFFLLILLFSGNHAPALKAVVLYYRYAVVVLMVLIMLTVSAVTSVTSDTELSMRHRAAPVRMELLELTYLGADLLLMLFWWMLFFWTAVVLYGEAAYSIEGLLMAGNLLTAGLLSTALGFIIGIFTQSAQSRGILSSLIPAALAATGGSLELLNRGDETVYLLRSFTPVFWYQKALDEISGHRGMLSPDNMKSYTIYIGIQLIFALMVLTLGMMLDKQRKMSVN